MAQNVPGLNPKQTAQEEFSSPEEVAKRHALVVKYNYLEPPFPWKVVAFSPGLFNLNDIPDPLEFRPVHLR